jgi:hypothetical protein
MAIESHRRNPCLWLTLKNPLENHRGRQQLFLFFEKQRRVVKLTHHSACLGGFFVDRNDELCGFFDALFADEALGPTNPVDHDEGLHSLPKQAAFGFGHPGQPLL